MERLSKGELAAFRDWFASYEADVWDVQIEQDIDSGKLEGMASEALADYKAGRAKEL